MSGTLQIPKWAITVGAFLLTLGSLGAGVVSAGWAARGVLEEQTQAITSLRQTINETVNPALAEVRAHGAQLGVHETRLAVVDTRMVVFERSCCGIGMAPPLTPQAPPPVQPKHVGVAVLDAAAIAPQAPRVRHERADQ